MVPAKSIRDAAKWIHKVALGKMNPPAGSSPSKGYATYTEFCQHFKLGDPHNNHYMEQLLLAVMKECAQQGWPDLASLVIHEYGTGQREGPGDGWYEGHGLWIGDTPTWKRYRDECWRRATQFTIP
ncbi:MULTISPECIES: hypothetical protein [Myxococcus]|uniref:hypothetical protein n=1 Tax=Myxococcus TaxID=32 RepID=UPI0011437CF7|nr:MULTISPECIES: hypothetical protein [Myxococcus]NOJ57913.1 hypothetical protein [Myxococcus xanthus]QPM80191.1 hypothetical protein I5Q59_02510 [Myxococcus xanthus]QVW69255.1 hypothetical protein JTM82_06800 [Myxococcus xanthus DZ2]UEO04618.1 hypothetical protein K1515_36010 [Myxococcus xanthus DZ2]UYI15170.1 hypothetical protein N3T43_02415 [Myxococcus xanthus]